MNEELTMLREHARKWAVDVAARTTPAQRAGEAAPALWREMTELGWAGVAIAEEQGGHGLGLEGAAALLQALGRELIASPLLPSAVLAATALAEGGDAGQQMAWLPRIAAGEVIAAVALAVPQSGPAGPVRAVGEQGGWRLSGEARFVAWGTAADLFVVEATDDAGISALYLLPSENVGVEALDMVDGRDRAHLRFERTAAERLGAEPARLLQVAQVAQAVEMLGMAERALEITLEYLRTREQFGQLIGAFQALQHRAAQAYIELETARACVVAALPGAVARSDELPALAALAKLQANDCLHRITLEMVQMHGGIGMTAEHVAGDYLKAARVAEMSFGADSLLLGQYAAHLHF